MFKVAEILQATSGKLLRGEKDFSFRAVSIDSRTVRRGDLFVAIKGDNFDGHNFIRAAQRKGAKGAVVSRAIDIALPADFVIIQAKDTTCALGKIANFHRMKFDIPVIAVTGSNGKTTTKDMLACALKRRFKVLSSCGTQNNHIGVPRTLLRLKPFHQAAVLELGTNHFGEIDYLAKICCPTAAIIANIGPSHLEFLKNTKNVFKEKKALLKSLKKGQAAIVNRDDKYLSTVKSTKAGYKVISFGIQNKSDFMASGVVLEKGRTKFYVNKKHEIRLNTPGFHNIYNCLAAVACCKYLGLDYDCIQKALQDFRFPPGRLEVKDFDAVKVIDDTYNANPLSLKNAIDVLASFNSAHRKVLICADMLELGAKTEGFHFSLGRYIADSGIGLLISVGKLAKLFCAGAISRGMKRENIFNFCSSEAAAKEISSLLKPEDICLVKGSRIMKMERIVEALKNQPKGK